MKPYELLARFDPSGNVVGVSVRTLVTIDGRDYESDPSPLSGASDPAFVAFADSFATAAVAERDALALQLVATQAELSAAQLRLSQLEENGGAFDLTTIDGVRQFISARRYSIETAGIVLGSQFISTGRDEIGHWFPRFYNALLWIQGDARLRATNPNGLYPFKPKNHAPTVLIADQVVRVYECMAWFINECFAREAELWARVDAGERFDIIVDAVNNPATWPANTFDWEPPA